jgi:hypothetical protein
VASLSTYAVNNLHGLTLRDEAWAMPTDLYLGWFTAVPGPTGGAQAAGGREEITFNPAAGGAITQDAEVAWPSLHTADQMLAGFGIWDAPTAGNLIAFGRRRSQLVRANRPLVVPAGALTIASNDEHISVYLANAWLDHALGVAAYTPPVSTFLAHYTVAPTAVTTGTEVADGGYARALASWAAPTDRRSVLAADVTWEPLHTDDDQDLEGWALLDNDVAGEILWFNAYPSPITVVATNTVGFSSGSITLRAD